MTVTREYAGSAGTAAGNGDRSGVPDPGQKIPVRELLGDQALDALLAQSRDAAGGLRLTGEGALLGGLVKAVLERGLEAGDPPKRDDPQDGADRDRAGGAGGAPRPGRVFRAGAGAQAVGPGRR